MVSGRDSSGGPPRLHVRSGPLAGTSLPVRDGLTIGRRPENDLRLPDELVSRFHARIERHGSAWWLIDLGSRRGTIADGRPIPGRLMLSDGQEVLLGQTQLGFTMREATPTTGAQRATGTFSSGFHAVPEPGRLVTVQPSTGPTTADLERQGPAEVRRAGRHLAALLATNRLITTELDPHRLFERILDALFDTYPVHRAALLGVDGGGALATRAWRVRGEAPGHPPFHMSRGITERALRERVGVLTLDAGHDARFDPSRSIIDQDIRSAICAPMIHQDEVLGVIYLDTVGVTHAFREEDLQLLHGIAAASAGALRNALLVAKLESTALDTVVRLAVAAEYRDDETGFHIHRMADYAAALATALGHDPQRAEMLRLAAPMHDLGKVGIPDSILKKPGKLTPEEYEVMKQHTVIGSSILSNATSELLRLAQEIALGHHERFDGGGYPKGLSGADIPISARIVAVADVFDALTSRRCYKPAFEVERALQFLREGSGGHFDPEVVDAFFRIQPDLLAIRSRYAALEERAAAAPAASTPAHLLGTPRVGPASPFGAPPSPAPAPVGSRSGGVHLGDTGEFDLQRMGVPPPGA